MWVRLYGALIASQNRTHTTYSNRTAWVRLMGYIVINTMLKNLVTHLEKKNKAVVR